MTDLLETFARKATAEMEDLNRRVASCAHATSTPVLGAGNSLADIFVVKVEPDDDERGAGLSSAGRLGDVVARSADKLGLPVDAVYSTNLAKCGQGRADCPDRCRAYLREELEIVQPRIVLALGKAAADDACQAVGVGVKPESGTVTRSCGRPTLVTGLDFDEAMASEDGKKQLWHAFKLVAAEYLKG